MEMNTERFSPWYLQFEDSRFGPLTPEEVRLIVNSGKLQGRIHVWKQGMQEWKPVENYPELTRRQTTLTRTRTSSLDKRTKGRKPLLALVRFDNTLGSSVGLNVYTGKCHDISPGGILIMSKANVGYEGTLIHLEVTPIRECSISPFSAKGRVAHVLPDEIGFGVQFTDLSEATRAQLEAFARASGTRST